MIKIAKLFKKCTMDNLSQGFHDGHKANDWAGKYGTPLVAPFAAKVTVITGIEKGEDESILDPDMDYLKGGSGIRLQSIEDPTLSIVIWHCVPYYPVKVGDIVKQGQIVAYMGNTGLVYVGGKYVRQDLRLIFPYLGTHTHATAGTMINDVYTALDLSKLIDFNIRIKYNVFDALRAKGKLILYLLTNN